VRGARGCNAPGGVAGLAPPAGAGRAAPPPSRTPPAVAARAAGVGLHLPDVWHLADLRGAAPHAPRGGTLTVPQRAPSLSRRPLRSPPWSPASGGSDVVGGSYGWGGCLRCEGCIGANENRPVGSAGLQGTPASGSSPPRLRASAPPRSPSAGFRCGQHPCSERGGPLLDAAGSPSLLEGEGVRGRGETALCNAPNHIFARMFCPSLNSAGDVGGGSHGCGACLRCEHHVGAAPRGRPWAGLGTPSWRIALLRIVVRADPTGAAPQAPRGGTLTVPQTPPQWRGRQVVRLQRMPPLRGLDGGRRARAVGCAGLCQDAAHGDAWRRAPLRLRASAPPSSPHPQPVSPGVMDGTGVETTPPRGCHIDAT
jgi:hypothetical protein